MAIKVKAIFDGTVFRPTSPVPLKPDTMVQLTLEEISEISEETMSFLDTASSVQLQGPPDWARNLDKYLYGLENDSEP
jgi:hypothetical protein